MLICLFLAKILLSFYINVLTSEKHSFISNRKQERNVNNIWRLSMFAVYVPNHFVYKPEVLIDQHL